MRLPEGQWPKRWKRQGFRNPVCPLRKALYGHPDSGTHWEQHCERHLLALGFIAFSDAWKSCYYHPKLLLVLIVYVDDFKMAGPVESLAKGWALIGKKVKIDTPTATEKYLGCTHTVGKGKLKQFPNDIIKAKTFRDLFDGAPAFDPNAPVATMTYDMTGFLNQCVTRYCELGNVKIENIPEATTPFLNDEPAQDASGIIEDLGNDLRKRDLKSKTAKRSAAPAAAAARKTPKKKAVQPTAAELAADRGALAPVASKIIMKLLYAARMARPDLLRAVGYLATQVTKWTYRCDLQLHRLMAYVHFSASDTQVAYVGDKFQNCRLTVFSDADFAGDHTDAKSTTGAILALLGPATFYPIAFLSKKQAYVSYATGEAELVAANQALRSMALPALDFWQPLLQLYEDHERQLSDQGAAAAQHHRLRRLPLRGAAAGRTGSQRCLPSPPPSRRTRWSTATQA